MIDPSIVLNAREGWGTGERHMAANILMTGPISKIHRYFSIGRYLNRTTEKARRVVTLVALLLVASSNSPSLTKMATACRFILFFPFL